LVIGAHPQNVNQEVSIFLVVGNLTRLRIREIYSIPPTFH